MDKELFVKNVEKICGEKGIKPTVACVESGAGRNFLVQIKGRGSVPSVEKVQMLARIWAAPSAICWGSSRRKTQKPPPRRAAA